MSIENITSKLFQVVADIVQIDITELTSSDNLADYGFDSISLTKLANQINEIFQVNISPSVLLEYETIDKIVAFLIAENQPQRIEIIKQSETREITQTDNFLVHSKDEFSMPKKIRNHLSIDEEIKKELFATPNNNISNEIAIIGMSCIVPGANNLQEFWNLIETGTCSITDFPAERRSWIKSDSTTIPSQSNFMKGGFISDIDKFDTNTFNISPREAKFLDPQQRLLLEHTWKAIEHAGYSPGNLAGTNTGIFIGIATNDYQQILESLGEYASHYTTGTVHALAANRLSYFFDFHGPSESINTACSSSLIAINRAVAAIRYGECELAIVGGVNALLHPGLTIAFKDAGMLSTNGLCSTFDESAEGYARGEGVGVIVLKKLQSAVEDKDRIYGVIKGSASNHGGQVRSLTVPSANAQANVILAALKNSHVSIDSLSYIEAHGTGTKLGDPLEIDGLKRAYQQSNPVLKEGIKANQCAVASVKANIGHLEAAAGIIGVIKVLLMLQYQKIPKSANFKKLNPYIQLTESFFYIPTETTFWPRLRKDGEELPRRAGISSFGFGGANAHVIIEEHFAERFEEPKDSEKCELPFLFSTRQPEKLNEIIKNFKDYIRGEGQSLNLPDIAYTLAMSMVEGTYRAVLLARTKDELIHKIELYLHRKNKEIIICLNDNNSNFSQALNELNLQVSDLLSLPHNTLNLTLLAKIWVHNHAVKWQWLFNQFASIKKVPMPLTKFYKKSYWVENLERNEKNLDIQINMAYQSTKINTTPLVNNEKLVVQSTPFKIETITNPPIINAPPLAIEAMSNKSGCTLQLKSILATVLDIAPDQFENDKPFAELGLDSILGIEFLKIVNNTFNLDLKAEILYEIYTVSKLAEWIEHHSNIMPPPEKNVTDIATLIESPKAMTIDKEKIIMLLAETLSADYQKISVAVDTPFSELGLDSILGVEFVKSIAQLTGLDIRAEFLYEYYTINKMWDYLQIQQLTLPSNKLEDQLFDQVYSGQLTADQAIEMLS